MSEIRVWDRFLTDQDRDVLAKAGARPKVKWGFGQRSALLLVDFYRAVYGYRPEPLLQAIETWPSSCGEVAWNALPHAYSLLESSRSAGIPVIFSTGVTGTVAHWSPSIAKEPGGQRDGSEGSTHVARNRDDPEWYKIIDELAPRAGEIVIEKASPSVFWGTPLIGHLVSQKVDTLIVCGESTSGCVRSTVVDARTNRFNVILAEEAVFDRHEASHAMNLFDMHQKYADVLPTAEITEHLLNSKASSL